MAAEGDHTAAVALLLARGAAIHAKCSPDAKTALVVAAQLGHTATVALLLGSGANVDDACANGGTSLHRAAEAGRVALLQLLLERKASVGLKTRTGMTALAAANHIPSYVPAARKLQIQDMLRAAGATL